MKLILDNFRCHLKETFKFKDDNINLITGKNGSGKSTILESILFVLYDLKKPQTIGKKKCSVTLKYKDITITRQKSPNLLKVKYKDNNRTVTLEQDVAQDYIDNRFGFKEIFFSSSYLRQGERNYILNGNISVLSSLVNLDISDKVNTIKNIMKNLKTDILKLETKIDLLKSQIKTVNIDIHEFNIENIEEEIEHLKDTLKRINRYNDIKCYILSDEDITNLKDELKDISNVINKTPFKNLQLNKDRFNVIKSKLADINDSDINKILSDIKDKLYNIRKKSIIISKMKGMSVTDIQDKIDEIERECIIDCKFYSCPNCKSKLTFNNNILEIPKLNSDVSKKISELKQLQQDFLRYDDVDISLKQSLTERYNLINEYVNLNINFEDYVDETLYLKSLKRKSIIETKLDRHNNTMIKINKLNIDVNLSPEDIEKRLSQLENIMRKLNIIENNKKKQDEVDILQHKYDKKCEMLDTYKLLKTHIQKAQHIYIQNYIDNINIRLNEYVSYVFDNLNVSLETIKKNKTNQNERLILNMKIMQDTEILDIEMLSGGEISKLSICLLLVMSEILNHDMIILDETLSNIDEDARNKITEILKQTNKTVIVVSHNPINDVDHEISL